MLISLLLGNQSQVMLVNTARGGPSRNKLTTTNKSQKSTSLRSLVPTGWAPGPAGDGKETVLLPLKITVPKEYTVPCVLDHYEAVRVELRNRAYAGGQDAAVVVINARLSTLTPGRVRPTWLHVMCSVIVCKVMLTILRLRR